MLSDDRRMSNVDHLGEPWALRLPTMSVEGGELDGHIDDQQGLFNLNNLVRGGKVNLAQLRAFPTPAVDAKFARRARRHAGGLD